MNTNFDSALTYRDYVVHIFTGVLFNIFLVAALWPIIPADWRHYEFHNEIIMSLMAIPVLFLEGHLISAIDRLFMVVPFKWYFILLVKHLRHKQEKKYSRSTYNHKRTRDREHYRKVAYKLRLRWYDSLLHKHPIFFFLLFSPRILGQKVVRKDKDGILIKTSKKGKKEEAKRYYVLSDFFKGCITAAFIAMGIAFFTSNWFVFIAMVCIIVLSRQRTRYYSMLYVKYRYVKR